MSGHVWNGSAWERVKTMHVWNGSIFEQVKEAWQWDETLSQWVRLYAQPVSITDDFNRANSSTIGPLWNKFGTNSAIESNSYATTGTTDGSRGIVTIGTINNNDGYVECVLGGADTPKTVVSSSIVGRMNSGGSSGIALNIFSNHTYVARMSGSPTSPTMTDFADNTVGWASGDTARLEFEGDNFTVKKNGTTILTGSGLVNQGTDYRHAGLIVRRASFNDSVSFNSFKVADIGA